MIIGFHLSSSPLLAGFWYQPGGFKPPAHPAVCRQDTGIEGLIS
jgi:hypothetical protein